MKNRSLPVETVLPHVDCQSVPEAIAWLSRVFGFREHYRYGEPGNESGAQVFAGRACIMLKQARGNTLPAELGFGTQSLTIFIDDIEAHYEHAKAAGATIVEEPQETVYGEFQYAALDLNGHHWQFSHHAKDLAPQDWGAQVADPE
jgi:uncharacterized glyoxalase superfamily protein PhnB